MMAFYEAIAQRGLASPWENDIQDATGGDAQLVWLTKAIISRESGWDPAAVGDRDKPNPSYGLMQVTLPTARLFDSTMDVARLMDPPTNISIGVAYLADKVRSYGSLAEAISAYNAGHPRLDLNRAYTDDVLTYYVFFLNHDTGEQMTPQEAGASTDTAAGPGAAIGAGVLVVVAVLAAILWRSGR